MWFRARVMTWALLARSTVAAIEVAADAFDSVLRPCPAACENTPENWTVFPSLRRLKACGQLMLDFAIHNALDSTMCVSVSESKVSLDLSVSGRQGPAGAENLQAAIQDMKQYLSDAAHCETTFPAGYRDGTMVAVYSGAAMDNGRTVPPVLQHVADICLSKGNLTLPAPPNAVCDPAKPGSGRPSAGHLLADLNPPPLNSCCNVWGQCVITPAYYAADLGPTANPGAAPAHKNVFKCDMSIEKILSVGGWGCSTNPATSDALMSTMMSPSKVDEFVSNLMSYLDKNGRHGVDIDWEYPGVSLHDNLAANPQCTESMYTLAMVTKDGVLANEINVGVSSHYGRSFGLNCTETAGCIFNAEIDEILDPNRTGTEYMFDAASDSDAIFYGNHRVVYMSDTIKDTRTPYFRGLNVAGTVDWTIDLQEFTDDDRDPYDDDDVDGENPPENPFKSCDATWTTFEELDAHADSVPQHCVAQYTLTALEGLLTETISNYTDLINKGYNDKFGIYAEAVAGRAGASLKSFNNNGSSYASCIVTDTYICCDGCKLNQLTPSHCFKNQCYEDCTFIGCSDKRGDGVPQPKPVFHDVNETESCPPDSTKCGYPDLYNQSVYWTWTNSSGFFAELAELADLADIELSTGIPKGKTKMGNHDFGNTCLPSTKLDDECGSSGVYSNVPLINGYSSSASPGDIVTKGLDRIKGLPDYIDGVLVSMKLGGYIGDELELVDSLSLPIFMLASATESMGTIVQISDEIIAEQRKVFRRAFLYTFFLILPLIGEIIDSLADLAEIGLITDLVGGVGYSVIDIYTIVYDPGSPPIAVLDKFLSPQVLANAAKAHYSLCTKEVAKLGDKVKARMDTVDKLKGTCVPSMVGDS
ncbi:Killer toxin subunits alpha/beta [Tolypocladium ophioglossoides CBS 100239]|uniref:Killer toxin subunits alpha/beta n=1 Tax=Tolypocladium ophioglossoides (strain CBS 100239) TaxID=1163406 RepID=A0A0L0NMR6_TOLOC|nr:Killer toxin subunits alpha/beta [Tolypocladium ophioglossoides CBS 100239]